MACGKLFGLLAVTGFVVCLLQIGECSTLRRAIIHTFGLVAHFVRHMCWLGLSGVQVRLIDAKCARVCVSMCNVM